jgi:hypothetical protein
VATKQKDEISPVAWRSLGRLLKKPLFQDVLREWAVHIESSIEDKVVDATTFANLYLEMMRDPRTRKEFGYFFTFMLRFTWQELLVAFRKAVDTDTSDTFDKPEAEKFYKQFKDIVVWQVMEFWAQFLKPTRKPRKRLAK